MTAPGESQLAHCRDCAHRLGSGCGCECCPWAGEAVLLAAGAIWDAHTNGPVPVDKGQWCNQLARAAVQAAPPVVRAAAAAERAEVRSLHELIWMPPASPDGRPRPACHQCTAVDCDERSFTPWPCPRFLAGPAHPDDLVAAAAAAERERIIALAEAWEAAYEKPCDKPGHLHTLTTPFADLLRGAAAPTRNVVIDHDAWAAEHD